MKLLGVEIDIENMTLEEMEELLKEVQELHSQLSSRVRLRKMSTHKYSSNSLKS